jgi:nucleotidyltransferase/DNA polymerase involved in DNA repair
MKQQSEALESIPGIGVRLTELLHSIGIRKVSDLKGGNPERLYSKLEETIGAHVDRCVLYAFRNAVYFASHKQHDPAKLKWWYWKDERPNRINCKKTPNKAL